MVNESCLLIPFGSFKLFGHTLARTFGTFYGVHTAEFSFWVENVIFTYTLSNGWSGFIDAEQTSSIFTDCEV